MINMSKQKPPLAIGGRYVALPGSATYKACDDGVRAMGIGGTTYNGCAVLRLDEHHPCGALEFVVIAVDAIS